MRAVKNFNGPFIAPILKTSSLSQERTRQNKRSNVEQAEGSFLGTHCSSWSFRTAEIILSPNLASSERSKEDDFLL